MHPRKSSRALWGRERMAAPITRGVLVGFLAVGVWGCRGSADSRELLRTVDQVKRLGENEIARSRHVELHGVITLLDPGWRLMAIQDGNEGILVEWPASSANLKLGDRVEVTGATSIDNHVPSIVAASI